jgi:hypothetical protein
MLLLFAILGPAFGSRWRWRYADSPRADEGSDAGGSCARHLDVVRVESWDLTALPMFI